MSFAHILSQLDPFAPIWTKYSGFTNVYQFLLLSRFGLKIKCDIQAELALESEGSGIFKLGSAWEKSMFELDSGLGVT